jgi:peptidoglycan/LPS O-acetylase OafA/YrhL
MPARLFDPGMPVGFGANGPLWMVSIVVGLYCVVPLVARPYLRHPLLGLGIAAGVTVAWKLAVTEGTGAFVWLEGGSAQPWLMELTAIDQLPAWSFSFALGMTGAWGYVRLQPKLAREDTRRWAVALATIAGVAFAACAYAYGHDAAAINGAVSGSHARTDTVLGLGYSSSRALLMAAVVAGPLWLQRPFTLAPVRRLSDLSYGLYLIHLPVAFALGAALLGLATDGSPTTVALWLTIVLSVSLLYAHLTRRHIERPLVDWARRLGDGKDDEGDAAGAGMTPAGWPAIHKPSRS